MLLILLKGPAGQPGHSLLMVMAEGKSTSGMHEHFQASASHLLTSHWPKQVLHTDPSLRGGRPLVGYMTKWEHLEKGEDPEQLLVSLAWCVQCLLSLHSKLSSALIGAYSVI